MMWPTEWGDPISYLRNLRFVEENIDVHSTAEWTLRNSLVNGRLFSLDLSTDSTEEEPCYEITEHENLYELFECEE